MELDAKALTGLLRAKAHLDRALATVPPEAFASRPDGNHFSSNGGRAAVNERWRRRRERQRLDNPEVSEM